VSRAYYAAYNSAKEYAITKAWTPKKRRIPHGELWDLFQHRERSAEEKEIGATGSGLMDDRHEADYDVEFACAKKACDAALQRADQILTWLKGARALPPP